MTRARSYRIVLFKSAFALPRQPRRHKLSLITTQVSARVRSCCCSLASVSETLLSHLSLHLQSPECPWSLSICESLSRLRAAIEYRRARTIRTASLFPWDTPSTHIWHSPRLAASARGSLPLGAHSQRPLARPKTPSPCARSVRRAPSPAPRLPASACPRAPCGAPRGPRPSQRYRR